MATPIQEFECPACGWTTTNRKTGAWVGVDRDRGGMPTRLTVSVETVPLCLKCRDHPKMIRVKSSKLDTTVAPK